MPESISAVVLSPSAQAYAAELRQRRLPGLAWQAYQDVDSAREALVAAEVLFGAPDLVAAALGYCKSLRWVQSSWAGVEPLLQHNRRDYCLTGLKGVFGPPATEYVLAWLLALERRVLQRAEQVQWDNRADGSLRGKRVGIAGTGDIGSHLAGALAALGMSCTGLNRSGRQVDGFERCYATGKLGDFVTGLDYLVLTLPGAAATDLLFDAGVLAQLPRSAVLVNIGRGSTVDTDAVVAALQAGRLRAAVLDVLPSEPLPNAHPWWQVQNLYLTSHTAAPTPAAAACDLFCDNYRRYRAGEPLRYPVDFVRGY